MGNPPRMNQKVSVTGEKMYGHWIRQAGVWKYSTVTPTSKGNVGEISKVPAVGLWRLLLSQWQLYHSQ